MKLTNTILCDILNHVKGVENMTKQYGIYFTKSKYQKYIDFFAQKKKNGLSVSQTIKSLIDKDIASMSEEERQEIMKYEETKEEE